MLYTHALVPHGRLAIPCRCRSDRRDLHDQLRDPVPGPDIVWAWLDCLTSDTSPSPSGLRGGLPRDAARVRTLDRAVLGWPRGSLGIHISFFIVIWWLPSWQRVPEPLWVTRRCAPGRLPGHRHARVRRRCPGRVPKLKSVSVSLGPIRSSTQQHVARWHQPIDQPVLRSRVWGSLGGNAYWLGLVLVGVAMVSRGT